MSVLHAIMFFCTLGIIEAIQSPHKIARNPADTFKFDASANQLGRRLSHSYKILGIHQHGE